VESTFACLRTSRSPRGTQVVVGHEVQYLEDDLSQASSLHRVSACVLHEVGRPYQDGRP